MAFKLEKIAYQNGNVKIVCNWKRIPWKYRERVPLCNPIIHNGHNFFKRILKSKSQKNNKPIKNYKTLPEFWNCRKNSIKNISGYLSQMTGWNYSFSGLFYTYCIYICIKGIFFHTELNQAPPGSLSETTNFVQQYQFYHLSKVLQGSILSFHLWWSQIVL